MGAFVIRCHGVQTWDSRDTLDASCTTWTHCPNLRHNHWSCAMTHTTDILGATESTVSPSPDTFTLYMGVDGNSRGGIPLTLAAKLMITLSEWFPGSTIADPSGDAAVAFKIPWDQYRLWCEREYEAEV